VNSESWKALVKNWYIISKVVFVVIEPYYLLDVRQKNKLLIGQSSQGWHRLVVSGGAERRRRTTRRCIRKVMKAVAVRRIIRNVRCISMEVLGNVFTIKNPGRRFRPPETSGSLPEPAGNINVSGRNLTEITGSGRQYSGPECLRIFPVTSG